MLDLETMGNGPNAAIVAIGAVVFDPVAVAIVDDFYTTADLKSSVNNGGIIDAETVKWWMRQEDNARSEIFAADQTIHNALNIFNDFLYEWSDRDNRLIYGNGSDFDNVILASAYQNCGVKIPWKFYNNRCYRTLKNLRPDIKFECIGTAHNALDDAKSQAVHLMKIMSELNKLSDYHHAHVQ